MCRDINLPPCIDVDHSRETPASPSRLPVSARHDEGGTRDDREALWSRPAGIHPAVHAAPPILAIQPRVVLVVH
jgi:hypothetical protein